MDNQPIWDEDIAERLAELQEYYPLALESATIEYLRNLFNSGYSYNDFYNNLYLNMYHFYIFVLHSFLVRVYKLYADEKSLQILQKMKVLGKKVKNELKLDKIRHNTFNYLEKDSRIHLAYLLDLEDDSNLKKRHQEIFELRDAISHFNETTVSKTLLLEYLEKMLENFSVIQQTVYQPTKQLLYDTLEEAMGNDLVDESNFATYFEELNFKYYLTFVDYDKIRHSGYLDTIEESSPKYYIDKYIKESLWE